MQQGDPFGPLFFCLAIHKLTRKMNSPLNLWYLDDGVLAGDAATVVEDLKLLMVEGAKLGLELNFAKCEVFSFGGGLEEQKTGVEEVLRVSAAIRVVAVSDLTLLGAPLLTDAIPLVMEEKTAQLGRLVSRVSILSSHHAFFLLKNCLALPKLLYVLRCSPVWQFSGKLQEFDAVLRRGLVSVCNIRLDNTAWSQATLPVALGGLGLRRADELSLPAYLASAHSVSTIALAITATFHVEQILAAGYAEWSTRAAVPLPEPDRRTFQRDWDQPLADVQFARLLAAADIVGKARLRAVATKESGSWLNALPLTALGTHLIDNVFRVAVGLRLGAPLCIPHTCGQCGGPVDQFGHHGLSCRFSAGRHSRHTALNELIRQALSSAEVPATKEPPGLLREDGKRPDGMTLTPWKDGKSLVWDVTCVDSVALSHLVQASSGAGKAAEHAEQLKVVKYSTLPDDYIFCPVGFETFGSWGPSAKLLLKEIGKRGKMFSGERRFSEFLSQRVGIAVQRGNAASVLGTAGQERDLAAVFYVLQARESF